MSLFGSIQLANNALFAAQTGLQVTGNNIANAGTPGYMRQQMVTTPAPTQMVGNLPIGLGVQVKAIVQSADRFLNERLRGATSDLSQSQTQADTYVELESIIGELSDTDLSTSFNKFFASIQNVLNQPSDNTLRNLAAVQGGLLTDDIRRLSDRVSGLSNTVNTEVASMAGDINALLKEVATLNARITITEGGGLSASDAVGLRDQRETALSKLAEMISIRTVEQEDGSVTVFAGGDYLVSQGDYREVSVSYESKDAGAPTYLHIADFDSTLSVSSGKLAGLYAARDDIIKGFVGRLDNLSRTLTFEFNKLYSSGQGLRGYDELVSESAVADGGAPLDQAGLPYTPVNGSFQVLVKNTRTGATVRTDIPVNLNGLDDDITLDQLVTKLNSIEGISADVTSDRHLRIRSDAPELEFGFANDTSGLLASLGVNTFFSGTSSSDIGVNSVVRDDPSTFAASLGGFGEDADNAMILAEFGDRPLESQNNSSLIELYDSMINETTQASAVTQSVTDGFRTFQQTLESQQLGITGVSIDDEVVKMITYQRIYQASARFIAAIGELMDTLVNL